MYEMVTRSEIYIPATLDLSKLKVGFGEKPKKWIRFSCKHDFDLFNELYLQGIKRTTPMISVNHIFVADSYFFLGGKLIKAFAEFLIGEE